MRHYIYLEEHRMAYASGKPRFAGEGEKAAAVLAKSRLWETRGASLDSDLKKLAEYYGLSGKRVTLVLGLDLSFLGVVLPRGSRFVAERMALNQLDIKAGSLQEAAAAIDIRHSRVRDKVYASMFYMEGKRLTEYKNAVAAAGMACSHVLAVPDCMALAAKELWKERSHLIVDVGEDQLGLYLVSRGHCLAFTTTHLKAPHFFHAKGEALLYQEIAEQAEQLFKQASEYDPKNSDCFRPECTVLLGNCLPFPDKGAASLEQLLRLPCFARILETGAGKDGELWGESALPPGLLAACMTDCFLRKRKPVKVKESNRRSEASVMGGICGVLSKGWMVFLLINAAAALGVGIWARAADREAKEQLKESRSVLMESEYKKKYQEAADMEKALGRLAARQEAWNVIMEDTARENLLSMDAFQAFISSMEPDMEVESIAFEGSNGILSIVISMSDRGQIPLYVERVKETGVFPYVSHSLWEQKEEDGMPERFLVVVNASLAEGGTDEAN